MDDLNDLDIWLQGASSSTPTQAPRPGGSGSAGSGRAGQAALVPLLPTALVPLPPPSALRLEDEVALAEIDAGDERTRTRQVVSWAGAGVAVQTLHARDRKSLREERRKRVAAEARALAAETCLAIAVKVNSSVIAVLGGSCNRKLVKLAPDIMADIVLRLALAPQCR